MVCVYHEKRSVFIYLLRRVIYEFFFVVQTVITLARMSPTKRHHEQSNNRRKITVEVKREIIHKRERGVCVADLARTYNRSTSTICTILKNKDKIMEINASKGVTRISAQRPRILDDVERLLLEWINEKQMKGDTTSENKICEKAKVIFDDLVKTSGSSADEGKQFKASRGWFENFKKRTEFHNSQRHGEGANSDTKAVENVLREFRENEDTSKSSQGCSGYPTTLMLNSREDDLARSCEASTPPASASLETTSSSTTEVVHEKGELLKGISGELHMAESSDKSKAKFTPALPETATVEIVVRCDGIVERTELKREIQPIADMLARGDYSFLSEEYKHLLRKGVAASYSKSGTFSNTTDFGNGNKAKKKIHYLVEAKDEMYKLLSRVVLSKQKFKKLLLWMKSLHLVAGKNGKYYLSERNLLGATCVTNGGDKDVVKSVPEMESWRRTPTGLPTSLHQPTITTVLQNKDTQLFLEPQMFQNPNKLATSVPTSTDNKPLFVLMSNKSVPTSQTTAILRPSLNTSIVGVSSTCTLPSIVTTTSNANLSNLVVSSVNLDADKSTSHSFNLKRKKRKSKYDIDHLVSNIENAPSPVPLKLFRVYDTNSNKNSTEHLVIETNSETTAKQEVAGIENKGGLLGMRTKKSTLNDHESGIQEQDSEEFEECEKLIQESKYGDEYDNYVVKTEPPDDYE